MVRPTRIQIPARAAIHGIRRIGTLLLGKHTSAAGQREVMALGDLTGLIPWRP
jgi:hypothetical protein